MKNTILFTACFALVCTFGSSDLMIKSSVASPVVQEKDDLEKMILKRIEEKKREMEAQRSKSPKTAGKRPVAVAPKSKKSTASRNIAAPSSRVVSPAATKNLTPARVRPTAKAAQAAEHSEMRGPVNANVDPSMKIRFNFVDEEWKDVIEWFAEEAGFGVFYGPTGPPPGTFTYFDSIERDVVGALDFLNSYLAVLSPPHVLVRNGTQLVLVNESGTFPPHLIKRVTENELAELGEFEVVSCEFDLGKLNGDVMASQIREDVSDVHLDGFVFVQAANRLAIRERVRVLRRFKEWIDFAKAQLNVIQMATYQVKYIEPESLLFNLRPLMDIAEGAFETEDGSFRFSVQPLGNTIYLKGSPDSIDEFERIAAMIDIEFIDGDQTAEKPYLHVHRISGDPEVVFQVIQTLLDGEPNVKLDQDATNGNLYLMAGKSIHDRVSAALLTMGGDQNFTIIPVRNITPSEAVSTIEDLLGIDSFDPEATGGPKLVADSDNDRVLVHGSPQEIAMVQKMIEEIDKVATEDDGPRQRTQVLRMSERQADKVMDFFQIDGIMDSMGRGKNRLNLIMPNDRKSFNNRNRFQRNVPPSRDQNDDAGSSNRSDRTRTSMPRSNAQYETTVVRPRSNFYFTSYQEPQGADEFPDQIGQTTEPNSTGSTGVEEPQTIPGAPVTIRWTEQGIVVHTEDLDAGDDVRNTILDIIGEEGEAEMPSLFYLQFRMAAEVKTLLDHILGLESGGGGGGGAGGIGGLLGGAVKNAVGGAAGGALGDLLGGGGGGGFGDSSAGAIELEGEDVSLITDARNNILIVIGATSNDLDFINDLIEILDVDSPPHEYGLGGDTYAIAILHRDPMEVKELVEVQLSRFFNTQNAGGQRNQNVEQQIQQQVLRQLQGGRKNAGNQGGGNSNAEQPKATLGVDETNGSLLVTGPKFIYVKVRDLVEKLDVKNNNTTATIKPKNGSAQMTVKLLQQLFPNNISVDEEDGSGSATGTTSGGRSGASSRAGGNTSSKGGRASGGNASSNNARQIEQSIINAIGNGRNRGGGGNRGGGRGGR